MRLLLLFYLGNGITTINVPQASSPITVKFDACLAVSRGDLRNQCSIHGLDMYMCICSPNPALLLSV
jgi:hypothetical protein